MNKKSIIERVIEEKERKKKEEEERNRLKKKIEEWKQVGWKTDKLEEIIEKESLEKIKEEMKKFEEGMIKLREIGRKIEKIDREIYGKELLPIETKLNNPYMVDHVEKLYNEVMKKIENSMYERMEEEKEEKKKIDISFELNNYFNKLLEKFENYRPDFSPVGEYFKNAKWEVEFDRERKLIKGILSKKLSKKIVIECEWYDNIKNLDLQKEFSLLSDEAFEKKLFIAKCYLAVEANEKIRSTFEKYSHMNFSPYLYIVGENKLIFNQNDWKTSLFSLWFYIDKKPKNILDVIKDIFGDRLFTVKDLENELRLNGKNAENLIGDLIKEYKIMEVEKEKYALVD